MKTSEELDMAADLIQSRGWVTIEESEAPWGEDGGTGPICLEGAVFAAAGWEWQAQARRDFECPAFRAVHNYLLTGGHYGTFADRHGVRPYWFNDEDGRTAAEVIEVLRAAALVESAREDAARESATEHAPALAEAVAAS